MEPVTVDIPRPAPPSVVALFAAGVFAGFFGAGIGTSVVIAVAHALGVIH